MRALAYLLIIDLDDIDVRRSETVQSINDCRSVYSGSEMLSIIILKKCDMTVKPTNLLADFIRTRTYFTYLFTLDRDGLNTHILSVSFRMPRARRFCNTFNHLYQPNGSQHIDLLLLLLYVS